MEKDWLAEYLKSYHLGRENAITSEQSGDHYGKTENEHRSSAEDVCTLGGGACE